MAGFGGERCGVYKHADDLQSKSSEEYKVATLDSGFISLDTCDHESGRCDMHCEKSQM